MPDRPLGAVSPVSGTDARRGLSRPRQLQGYATTRIERF